MSGSGKWEGMKMCHADSLVCLVHVWFTASIMTLVYIITSYI